MSKIKTFGDLDSRALSQLERCAKDAEYAVLCADHHVGYSQPIGGAVAYRDKISPSGVGYDIGCGNKAVRTPLHYKDVPIKSVMDEIAKSISFGMGRNNNEDVSHPVLDKIKYADFEPQRKFYDKAANQLGTVGGGNHYVDLFRDEEGFVWVGVHFGSRGFGHKTASGFMAISQGLSFGDKAKDESMDADPILFDTNSDVGQAYISAMTLAGEYAYAGRDWVVSKVLSILGTTSNYEVHNHHNFAWNESHHGEGLWVVRKGCTPAFPGQEGFVGGSMGGISVILEGVDGEESKESLYSTVHGAGRVMSRTEAAGKSKISKRYYCSDRECENVFNHVSQLCPDHPDLKRIKRTVTRIIKEGKVDWELVKERMSAGNIELRGGGADEAPDAYKNLVDVLRYHNKSIKVTHRLVPIGVAMAGPEIFDMYQD